MQTNKTYAFIINYNRLTLPRNIANYLMECDGIIPIIIDNNSDYPPLLEYYEKTPHKVIRLDKNWGGCVVYKCGILDDMNLNDKRFIVSDPDLDLSGIPKDFLHILHMGLDRHSFACKSGFSLEINDLLDRYIDRVGEGRG